MRTIVAVGGGEIGRIEVLPDGTSRQTPIETTKIDTFIINAANKKHPNMLFIGTASNDTPTYIDMITKHFVGRLGCSSVEPLNLIDGKLSSDEIKNKIFSADIIYVGGGDTTTMLKIWKQYGVDKMLYDAYQKGIVLAGISAGAICWFEHYDNMDDITDIADLDILSGLSFVKGFGVPHYNQLTEDEKVKINNSLAKKNIKGWTIDDCVALVFQDDVISIISCRPDRKAIMIP